MPYQKRTTLWNNIGWQSRPLCKKDCDNMNDDRRMHNKTAQPSPPQGREGRSFSERDLYKVPELRITETEHQ